MMFPNPRLQISAAEDWSDFFRGVDAAGAALIVDAPDEHLLSLLWPVRPQRDEIVAFMRERRLSVFAEPRAMWQGRLLSEIFPRISTDRCIGNVERSLSLGAAPAEGPWRVEGWAWDASTNQAFDYLIIVEPTGRVIGMARGGFRHGYFPGLFTDSQFALPPHTRFRASEWLGYVRQPVKSGWAVYGLLSHTGQVCIVRDDDGRQDLRR